jgi:secreted trypsin-like serine protease
VKNPAKTAPWVVSILFADTGVATSDASLLCSGSLIDSRTVLTAGHCVDDSSLENGYYYIQPAGTSTRIPVDASWFNPNFDPYTLRGDVSLLHLARPFKLKQYAQLATSSAVPKTLHLMGFGENESYGLPGQLWTTTMTPAGTSYIKVLSAYNFFDKHPMRAAVNFRKTTGLFSGGCHGDSGGPLAAYIKGKPVLYGVVSWGQPSCVGTASVFARVSVLRSIVLEGRAMLPSLAKSQYRGRPELTKKPTITGWTGNVGATLTCHAGSWTNHPGSYAYRWYTQDSVPGTDPAAGQSQTYQVNAADVKYPIACVVLVRSATTSNNYNVAALLANARVRPVIESVSINDGGTSTRSVGSVWICGAIAGGIYPSTSLSQAARTFSWTASNGALMPQTKHLKWTQDLIDAIPNGTAITCSIHVLTAQSNGVASTGTSAAVIAE